MTQEFKKGDVVKPNSGGLEMTVEAIDKTSLHCIWFDKNKLQSGDFDPETVSRPDRGYMSSYPSERTGDSAMSQEFKKGDVVKLNSGGPEMTIEAIDKTKTASLHCFWLDGKNKRQSRDFDPETVSRPDRGYMSSYPK